ncbi:3-oxoadipate enol-lactonase [Agrobacterium vitis]|uniref:3-oxoadipate enol-lactonase n=1 Tax=Agrobacterium vitis TaxID=373 RepID=A0AAE4WE18_AGRVI|nr:3-oxoadipate enol-lactonase [Agrobacterium vitis]MCF1498866.1 3-oxoadipate enol-lactonase [Allorhizobium sp. Av2]MCM2441232.1 3-oxoadipate enol-lactonase [Agrobacterium vitis]MUZ58384.1 3-oxoadipate enol-lactonase [Agrobacterium vitis]MVA65922.1 3-oxoadipate enol-lactonase [Agrobacterium vitis]MVA88056.1 3-oxoadipate enol-lactonase [Agrobacterium vitis]
MKFLKTTDAVIHYNTVGLESGKPVIAFANSLGTDFRIWDEVMDRLQDRYAFVLHDKRGHGLSDLGNPPYSMATHVDDMAALLDHLSLKQVIVVGLSVGGMIAQGLYASRPDLVRALILSNTAHKIGSAEMWNNRIATIQNNGIGSLLEPIMERWFTAPFRTTDNSLYAGCCTMLLRQPVEGYCGTCAALRDADFTEQAPAITVPTLCVVGDEDGSTPPALVQSLADLIAGSRFSVVSKAGHIPCLEQPDAYVAALLPFLDELA